MLSRSSGPWTRRRHHAGHRHRTQVVHQSCQGAPTGGYPHWRNCTVSPYALLRCPVPPAQRACPCLRPDLTLRRRVPSDRLPTDSSRFCSTWRRARPTDRSGKRWASASERSAITCGPSFSACRARTARMRWSSPSATAGSRSRSNQTSIRPVQRWFQTGPPSHVESSAWLRAALARRELPLDLVVRSY